MVKCSFSDCDHWACVDGGHGFFHGGRWYCPSNHPGPDPGDEDGDGDVSMKGGENSPSDETLCEWPPWKPREEDKKEQGNKAPSSSLLNLLSPPLLSKALSLLVSKRTVVST